jgi:hypothetical protein
MVSIMNGRRMGRLYDGARFSKGMVSDLVLSGRLAGAHPHLIPHFLKGDRRLKRNYHFRETGGGDRDEAFFAHADGETLCQGAINH